MKTYKIIASILACAQIIAFNPIDASDTEPVYDGSDMIIAILERGFDLSHETFVVTDDTPRLSKEASDKLIASTTLASLDAVPESVYVSAKVPFAYDYGDGDTDVTDKAYSALGTNLLSIAAGNGKLLEEKLAGATGTAPEAQILAMKVYSDTAGDVTPAAMISAINDAVVLGADVILFGVMSMDGFGSTQAVEEVNNAIENAQKNGVIVVAASGSAFQYGTGSVYENEYQLHDVNTDSPDVGTIAWPGNLKTTFTVTGAVSNTIESDLFTLSDGTEIPYGDSNYMFPSTTNGTSFDRFFDDKTLEYVIVNGTGSPEHFAAAGDLTGKLAVVERGIITFAQKATNAAAAGAIGLIVIDNQTDEKSAVSMLMDLTGAPIPAVIISANNGVLLKTAADKSITVKDGMTYTTYTRKTPSISDYMPSGSTSELSLKPDITAIGTDVQCATVNNGYTFISSSRAAAASVAGMCVCVKARFAHDYPNADADTLSNLTRSALVGSAQHMEYLSGSLYSPRIQGGGVASLDAALDTSILLTSNGSHKIEMGEKGSFIIKYRVTAHNISNSRKVCTLDAIVGSDGYDALTFGDLVSEENVDSLHVRLGYSMSDTVSFITNFTELSGPKVMLGDFMYQLNRASDNYEPYTFALEPGASDSFTVTMYIDEETYKSYNDIFPNGFFIEGFMRLTSGDESVSIPYLGFIGDYAASPFVDASLYTGEQHMYDPVYLYRYESAEQNTNRKIILGQTNVDGKAEYDADKLYFSPKYEPEKAKIILNLGLLRSITDATVTVTDASGELVLQNEIGNLTRTYASSNTGSLVSPQILLWDGRAPDNSWYIYPDGEYTIKLSYRAAGSDIPRKLSYTVHIDTTAPTLDSYEFSESDTTDLFKVSASDNYHVREIKVIDSTGTYGKPVTDGVWDISELNGKYIYIELYDAAFNSTVVRINNQNYSTEE